MARFSLTPQSRKTRLYFYCKKRKEWICDDKIIIETQNTFKGKEFYKKLEDNFTDFDNIVMKILDSLILENKSKVLSSEHSSLILRFISAIISINPNNITRLRRRAKKNQLEVIAEEGRAKKDLDNDSIYKVILAVNKILSMGNFIFHLKCFNSNKLLICTNNTVICAQRDKKKTSYLLMPLSYNKAIICSLKEDNIHLDELTVDVINNLAHQSDCTKLCSDEKSDLFGGNPKILRKYKVKSFINDNI